MCNNFLQEAVVTARFSAISTGTMVNGVWYKPVEQFILPKVSFSMCTQVPSTNTHTSNDKKVSNVFKVFGFFVVSCSVKTRKLITSKVAKTIPRT